MGDMTRREAILGGLGLVGMLGVAGAQELESIADEYSLSPTPQALELANLVYAQKAHEGVTYSVDGGKTIANIGIGEKTYVVTVDVSKKSKPLMTLVFEQDGKEKEYRDDGIDGNVNTLKEGGVIVYDLIKDVEASGAGNKARRSTVEAQYDFHVRTLADFYRT